MYTEALLRYPFLLEFSILAPHHGADICTITCKVYRHSQGIMISNPLMNRLFCIVFPPIQSVAFYSSLCALLSTYL